MLFLDESYFIYDPDYNHWCSLSEPKEFQFEADYSANKGSDKRR